MKKPKVTVKSLRVELNNAQKRFDEFRSKVRAYVLEVNNQSKRRPLMTIEPANAKGQINGLTIPELVMLVNLSEGTGEFITLETTDENKNLKVVATKKLPRTPWELL